MDRIAAAGLLSLEIGILADVCLRWCCRKDQKCRIRLNRAMYRYIWGYSVLAGIWIGCCLREWGRTELVLCGVLAAYLLVASIQDGQSCEVYDFLHLCVLPAGAFVLLFRAPPGAWKGYLVFAALQFGLFMRMYGAADGMVFLVCALFESVYGDGLMTYLLHMAASFCLLAVVQIGKKNVNRSGNLKKPVAFVPYITAAVWLFL